MNDNSTSCALAPAVIIPDFTRDILESDIPRDVLAILLADRTIGKNIKWMTDGYVKLESVFDVKMGAQDEIDADIISRPGNKIIRPRVPIDIGIDVRANVLRNVPAVEPSRKGAQKNTPIGIVDGTMDGTMALRIVSVLKNEPSITIDKLSERLNVARRSLVRYMNILQESNRIKRIGGKRFGHWEVV